MRISTLLPVFLASYAAAAPSPRANHVVHETRAVEPLDWVLSRRLESHKVLPMRFGLVQQNIHRLEELLLEVSHPESPKYGQHYTPAEIVKTFTPSHETISAVTNWLVNSGFSRDRLKLSANKGWIHVNATTAEVEDLLDAEYHVYSHPSTGSEQIGESSFRNAVKNKKLFWRFVHQVAGAIQFQPMFENILISSSPLFISTIARFQTLCENVVEILVHLLCILDPRQIVRKLKSRQASRTVIKLSHPTASELYTQSITSPLQQTRTVMESVCL